jgi:hypothetical protein
MGVSGNFISVFVPVDVLQSVVGQVIVKAARCDVRKRSRPDARAWTGNSGRAEGAALGTGGVRGRVWS